MTNLLKNNRGMILLVTILIISIIVVVTIQFNTSMRSDLQAAVNLRDGVKLGYISRSALNLARTVLLVDMQENNYDTLHETWAQLPVLAEYASVYLDEGRFKLGISDYSGKIQLNSLVYAEEAGVQQLQQDILSRFLLSEEFELDQEAVDSIIDAIIDWIDEDDEESGFGGAEEFYYQSLEKPYPCKNGPMEFVEELLHIKGIEPELFYGTKEKPGIRKFLTAHGTSGEININTAEALVLRALADPIDEVLAGEMIGYRGNEENDLSNVSWYKSVPSFPGDIDIPAEIISVKSSYFEVQATAFLETMSKKVTGVIRRDADTTEVVSWKIE
jgi:general secretion pathway protein K